MNYNYKLCGSDSAVYVSYAVVHLFGAVEDVDHDAESSSEVLGRLRLAGTGRSSWCAAHRQVQRLRQRYVAPARMSTNHNHGVYCEATQKHLQLVLRNTHHSQLVFNC